MEGDRPPRVRAEYRRKRGSRIAALFGVLVGFALIAAIAWAAVDLGVGGGNAAEAGSSTGHIDTAPPKPILRIVFPEGFTRKEMAARIAAVNEIAEKERGISPSLRPKAYLEAAEDTRSVPEDFKDDDPPNLEGFLFPATYDFTEDTTSKQLVDDQLEAFDRAWSEVDLDYADSKNLTPYDVLIIASMIEKEVQVPKERALVAAVIYNRLKPGMPLGIDATVRYGFDIPPTQAILQSQLDIRPPVQHAQARRAHADADLQSRPRLAPGGRAPGGGRLPLLRPQARLQEPLLHGQPGGVPQLPARRTAVLTGDDDARRPAPATRSGTRSRRACRTPPSRRPGSTGPMSRCASSPTRLEEAVAGLVALGFRGANVTIPHKTGVLAFCDELDAVAERAGSVNTLVIRRRPRAGLEHGRAGGDRRGRGRGRPGARPRRRRGGAGSGDRAPRRGVRLPASRRRGRPSVRTPWPPG